MRIILHGKVDTFLNRLPQREHAEAIRLLLKLGEAGGAVREPYSKHLEGPLFELRGQGKIALRLLFAFRGDAGLVVVGFVKKTPKTPRHEIETAMHRLRNFDSI